MTEKSENWRTEDLPDEESFFESEEKAPAPPSVRIGTSGWSYRDWDGHFYANGTRPEQYLEAYATTFNTVELDSSFYNVPLESTVRSWHERTPDDFIFTAKFPRLITHERRLIECAEAANGFIGRMSLLEEKLGPLLLQFPPGFRFDDIPALKCFLSELPTEFRFAVEFRHASWSREETVDLLRERNICWAVGVGGTGPEDRHVTADFSYLRWIGDREIESFGRVVLDRSSELEDWAEWVRWAAGSRDVYGYFNNHYTGHAPTTARDFLSRLGVETRDPPAADQGDLFGP